MTETDHQVIDVIAECYPDLYETPEIVTVLHEVSIRRKRQGLGVDKEYIRWLYGQITEE